MLRPAHSGRLAWSCFDATSKRSAELPAGKSLEEMNNFWVGLLAAQTAASDIKPANRRHRVLSAIGGIALALLIGAGLFIALTLTD
jgi:hypothetical protein